MGSRTLHRGEGDEGGQESLLEICELFSTALGVTSIGTDFELATDLHQTPGAEHGGTAPQGVGDPLHAGQVALGEVLVEGAAPAGSLPAEQGDHLEEEAVVAGGPSQTAQTLDGVQLNRLVPWAEMFARSVQVLTFAALRLNKMKASVSTDRHRRVDLLWSLISTPG